MTSTPANTSAPLPDSAAELLADLRQQQRTIAEADARKMLLAAHWAAMSSSDSIVDPADHWHQQLLPIGGEGCPVVAEFCLADLAVCLEMSHDAARAYLSKVVETRYRLKQCWGRVVAGDLPAWRAMRIAERTITLSPDAATFVDRHVAPVAHKVPLGQLDRLVEEARVRFNPEEALQRARDAAETRHFDVLLDQVTFDGTVRVDGDLDLADAIALNDAVARDAHQQAVLGSTESLDVRRAVAVGNLARNQLALDLDADTADPDARPKGVRRPQQLVLHVHLSEAALDGSGAAPIARVENTRSMVAIEQVAAWAGSDATKVVIKPVIDLNDNIWVGSYEVPDRIDQQVKLRDGTCVHPYCTKRGEICDNDHTHPYDTADPPSGGQTETKNLAKLCRRHHRLKTTSGWTYTSPEPGVYIWTSPYGMRLRRDGGGTEILADLPAPPDPPES
ncbi:MAG TPA: hypothetical protein VHH53_12345 [Pseudonocardiaceae bacterium]|nr:hypothetical protein [Pseudonocardiaceae bacterium]